MRLRNIPGAGEVVSNSAFCIDEPAEWKGRWKELFENDNPLHLEIGMGKGRFIMDLARENPDINYIGIERYTSVLLRAVQKIESDPLPNIRFLCIDAKELPDYFEKDEVARIYLNFSDPWPKDRHAKRRLTSQQFLDRYEQVLAEDGRIEFKTDNQDLFQFSVDTVEAAERWNLDAKTYDLHHDETMNQGNIMTEYEEKFSSQGNPICKLIASRIIAFILIFTSVFSVGTISAPTQVKADVLDWASTSDVSIETPSACVIEVNTGTILYEKNMDEIHYPASITKVLTTMLAIENCDLDEIVTFSATAVYENEGDTSHIARELNEEMALEEVLYGVMLESANECAYATAEHVGQKLGGDYQTFVDLMNERAKELGCTNTHFTNANGLPDENHWTTAHDMALIARAAYQYEDFRIITGTGTHTIPADNKKEEYHCRNHNQLLYPLKTMEYLYEYCTGGKTGYTVAAGSTLVSYAEKDGMTLACVVMNTHSPNQYIDSRKLFDYCFDNYKIWNISENESRIAEDKDKNYGLLNNEGSFVTFDTNSYIILPKDVDFAEASYDIRTDYENGSLAEFIYNYNGREVGSVQLVASGAQVGEMPLVESEDDVDPEIEEVVIVNPWYIALVVVGVIVLGVLIFFIVKFIKNFYLIRHRWEEKKRSKSRFKEIRAKKHRRRRRDRLFR